MTAKSNRKTKVILVEGIRGLGIAGDVVPVSPGYARNFLLPQKIARMASKKNIEDLERKKAELAAQDCAALELAKLLAAKLGSMNVSLGRNCGDSGRIFGSVSRFDIAKALADAGIEVAAKLFFIPKPIKDLGEHIVFVDLHPKLRVSFHIAVVQSHA